MFGRHHCAFDWFVLALEVIADICHGYPFHTWLFADIFNQPAKKIKVRAPPNNLICTKGGSPFQHENRMWMTADIGMNSDWKAKIVILPVEVIEMVSPEILHIPRINPAM